MSSHTPHPNPQGFTLSLPMWPLTHHTLTLKGHSLLTHVSSHTPHPNPQGFTFSLPMCPLTHHTLTLKGHSLLTHVSSHTPHPNLQGFKSSPSIACLCARSGTPVCVCARTERTSGKLLPCSCCVACNVQTTLPGWSLDQATSSDVQREGRMSHSW